MSGGLSTLFTGRLGDFFLLLRLCSFSFRPSSLFLTSPLLLQLFLALSASTKCALGPFMGWLPRAMRAPTPVSALVHRSTLVTAGLFLLYLFSTLRGSSLVLLFFLSFFSLFSSGCLALFEEDFKKLVALSTLSQIAFCSLSVSLGALSSSYLHLLGHAFIKSCLFIQVGSLIYSGRGQQDSRVGPLGCSFLGRSLLLLSLLSLCGLLFSSASSSKE